MRKLQATMHSCKLLFEFASSFFCSFQIYCTALYLIDKDSNVCETSIIIWDCQFGASVQNQGVSRDVLLLDIALDNYFRLCIERLDKSTMAGDDLVNLTGLVLKNAMIAYESKDLQQVSICQPAFEDCYIFCSTMASLTVNDIFNLIDSKMISFSNFTSINTHSALTSLGQRFDFTICVYGKFVKSTVLPSCFVFSLLLCQNNVI